MGTTRKFLRNMDKVTLSNIGKAERLKKVVSTVTAMGFVLQPMAAMANTITRTDGGKLDVNGNVTNVWAGKVINDKVAMSVFKDFKVDANNIANMYFKEQANGQEAGSLVNFVNSRIDINGTVNALKGGKIGGNLFFLSKDGMAVGATGVINTGSLYVATPNANKINELQDSLQKGLIKDNLADNLVYSVPINKSGTITVMGKINAADDVHLRAPKIGIGENVSGDPQYDAQQGGTNASITTGVANFADIVNIKDAQGNVTVDSGLRGEALHAEKTTNGDIVLSAYNSYNDNYYGVKSVLSDIAGEKVNAELTVAKGAAVNAAGNAELTAQAVNNIDADIIENNADLKRVNESSSKTGALVGQIVDTKANITIDGEVTGKHVDIAANAANRYVSSETGSLTSFTQKLSVANINLDASYGKLNSEAKVNIGKDAVIKATEADTVRKDASGLPVTDSEGNPVIDKALNIHANSTIDLEVGANAGGIKLVTPSVTKLIPAVGVSYAEANNNAEVNIDGAIASAGSADIAANADSTVYASSLTKTGKEGNIVAAAATVANSENHSQVNIGETAKMAGQDLGNGRGTAAIGEDLSVKANSTNSVKTSASVVANDNTAVATAVNVTEHNSTADVNINASMKAGRNLAVDAANTLTENEVIANNGMGTTAAASKISELIQDSQTMQSITGPAGLVSVLKERIATGEYTPGWLSDILGKKEEQETPQPNAWDTFGDLFSAGASIGVANETNNSGISVGKGVQLEAGKDLSINATSTVEDTYMNANGIGRNNNDKVDKNALVNAAVLYANLQNDAAITVAGGNASDGTNVQLKGENVNVQAESNFIYQRIDKMVQAINELSSKVKRTYKNDDSETAAKIKEKLDALDEAAAAFDAKANPENGEKPSIYELVLTDEFKDYLDAANEFKEIAEKDEDNMDSISVGDLSALTAAAHFADVTRYTNFSAGTVNAGKDGEKEAKASVAGSATVTNIANNAKVLLGKNAVVEATKGKADFGAKSSQDDVVLTGKPSMNGGGSAAVGGTVGIGFADANSLVVVAEGAKITAGDINLKAENNIDHTSISIGAGKGGSVGVNGMISYMSGDSNSIVSVDDEAVLEARKNSDNKTTGKVNLEATNNTDVTTVAGAVSLGDSGAVGASVAIANFDRYNYASIGDNDYGTKNIRQELANALANTSDEKIKYILKLLRQKTGLSEAAQSELFGSHANDAVQAGSITASGVDVKAKTTGEILNVTIAGGLSTGGDSDEESTFSKILEMLGDVKSGLEGKIKALDSGIAEKIQGLLEKADKAKEVLPEKEDDKTDATKKTEKPASFTLTGAGSASVNLVDGDTAAVIDGAKINIVKDEAATNGGNVNVSASDSAMVTAASGAAGLSLKNYGKKQNGDTTNVGVAGAVAVNDVATGALAVIRDSKIDNADAIINNAEKSGAVVAAGVGMAVSTNAAGNGATNVAASVNASVNLADNKVYALMQDNEVNKNAQRAATSITNSAFDNDIQITGGLSANLSKGGSKGVAGGATVAYGKLENDVQAAMLGGEYNKITNADVTATTNMTQVGVAANASVTMGSDTSYAMSGNAAYNELTNDVNASVEGVKLTGESLMVAAYDTAETANEHTALLKARGFDADGSEYAEAAAAAANEEEDQDGNKVTNIDTSRKGNVIVTGAVSAGVTTGSDGGSAGASISISKIDNDYNASLKGSTITTTGAGSGEDLRGTNVTAKSNTMLVGVAAGVAGTNGNFGVGGSASWEDLDNDVTASIENSTIAGPKTDVNAISRAMAVNVAGQIGVSTGSNSKVGAGMAVAYNSLNNTTGAYVKGSTIYNPAASGAALNVNAANEGSVYSVGAAVGAGTSTATLNGAVVVNQGKSDVEAIVEDYQYQDEKNEKQTRRSALNNMNSVKVTSQDSSKQLAVVGAVSAGVGGKSKAAVGGTVVVNDIASQSNKAAIRNTDINTTNNGKIGVKATDKADLKTISIDMAMTTGNAAFSGAGAASLIDKETGAEVIGTNVDQRENASGSSDVEVKAASDSSITTVGVVLAGGKNAAGGLGISVNEIGADTKATIDGGSYKVKNLTADAESEASINAIGIAAGVAKNAGLAGNVGVNLIDNDTTTTIKNATITAKGTIAALAKSQDSLSNIAGTAGVAAGGQFGLGMGVAYNEIKGETASVVSDSSLTAAGEGTGVDVTERAKDSNATTTAKHKGIVVAADATHALQNIAISAGAAISADVGVGVAGTVTVNRILGATNAEINSTDLNKDLKDLSKADVLVNAADVTTSESHVGSLAVGVGADGGAGVGMASDTSVVSRNVTAQIDGGEAQKTANGHNVAVNALNKAQMMTNADGVAIAGGAYGAAAGAGTVSVAKLDAVTAARVSNIAGTTYGLDIKAEHKNVINQISAAAAVAAAAVSGAAGAGIGVVNDDSNTVAELSNSSITAKKDNTEATNGNITVKAANETDVTTTVVGVAASGVAAGLNVAVNNLNNKVTASVHDNTMLDAANKFAATANNKLAADFRSAAAAGGAGALAVGVGVNTIDTGVLTEVKASTVKAGSIDVQAKEAMDVDQLITGATAGALGVNANVSVTSIGAALADSYGDNDSDDSKAKFSTKDILAKANTAVADQDNISKSDKNAAGSTFGKYNVTAKSGANASQGSSSAEGVQVKVSNSALTATGNADIEAERHVDANVTSATATVSAMGASVSVAALDVERKTGVTLDKSSISAGDALSVASKQSGTAEVDAYQASAAGASVGVVYSGINLKGANAVNIMGSTLNAGNNLAVKTSDMSTGKLKTIGLSAAIAATANVFVADAKNNSTSTITIDSKDDENSALTSANENVTVEAKHGDGTKPTMAAEMDTVSVAGIASGLGFNTAVMDNSSTAISVGNNQSFKAAKDISIKAENNSVNTVRSSAVTGALGVAAGATGAEAKGKAASSLAVGSGNTFTAQDVNMGAKANVKNVAEIHSIGAGIGAITVNWAKATGKTNVAVNVGDNTYNASDAANINGESVINQKAKADGITAGLVTSGSNLANVDSEENINVVVGTDNGTSTAQGAVNITADGKIIHDVSSNGDGGALFDASPVAAKTVSKVKSATKVKVRGNWSADAMDIAAVHDNNNIALDTNALKAAVVGLSGVEAKSDINNDTSVDLTNANITTADDVIIKAQNDINYSNTIKANGYGVASGNALDTRDNFTLNSTVKLANSNITSKGRVNISALTGDGVSDTDGSDTPKAAISKNVTLESAGAVAGTWAVSRDKYNVNNNIIVDDDSSVTTAGNSNYTSNNDINMVATDMVGFKDVATANTQGGLVGAASAKLKADFTRNNNITVNGKLDSNYDAKLNAGGNSIMNVTLKSNAYNKTAAPIVANPALNYTMTQNNNVVIGAREDGAETIKTARNINLIGDSGNTTIALQSESYKWTQGGTTSNASLASTADGTQSKDDHLNNGVTVNGKLLAGKNTKLEITIDDGDDTKNLNGKLSDIVSGCVGEQETAYNNAQKAYDKYAKDNDLVNKRKEYNKAAKAKENAESTAKTLNDQMSSGDSPLRKAAEDAETAKATLDTASKEWWDANKSVADDGKETVSITVGEETKVFEKMEDFLAQNEADIKAQYIAAAKAKENAGATTDPSASGTTGGTTTNPGTGSAANTVDLSSNETGSNGENGSTETDGSKKTDGKSGEGGQTQAPTLEDQAEAFVKKLNDYQAAQEKYEKARSALGTSASNAGGVTLNETTHQYEVSSEVKEAYDNAAKAYNEIVESAEYKNLVETMNNAEQAYDEALNNTDDLVNAANDYIKNTKDKEFVKIEASDWFTEQNDGSVLNSLAFQNYAQGLTNRLTELTNLIQVYGDSAAGKSFLNERTRLQNELVALGLGYFDNSGAEPVFVFDDSASTVPTADLKNILVTGGNINIKGGSLSGKGEMTAVGGPEVKITNNSKYYLRVNDISIDGDGGNVKFNDAAIKSNNDLTVNDSPGKLLGGTDSQGKVTSSNNAQVTIESTADKPGNNDIFTPDVGVFGTIYNPFGKVTIKNAHNNIYLAAEIKDGEHPQKGGSIKAREITLTSGGNITQGYNDGIENIGGNPHYAVKSDGYDPVKKIQTALIDKLADKTSLGKYRTAFKTTKDLANFLKQYVDSNLTQAEAEAIAAKLTDSGSKEKAGMYASGAIYINAAAVNINGTVQSGYDTYKVDVDQDLLAKRAQQDHTGITDFKRDEWLVTTGTAGAVYDSKLGKYVYNVSAWYNPLTGEIITEDIDQSGGGSIHIMGAVASTGGGQLIALDGSANVTINNDGNTKLTVGSINTDSVKGKITIVDTNTVDKNDPNGYKTTVYTRDGVQNGTAKYDPKSGQMYIWTSGETSQVISSYKAEYDSKWFGLSKKSWEDMMDQEDKVQTDYQEKNAEQTDRGDVINSNTLDGDYLKFGGGISSLLGKEATTTSATTGNVYQISFERSAKLKQGTDASGNLLYWTPADADGNQTLTTEKVTGEINNEPYYLKDADGNPIYDSTKSDIVQKKKKKLWGLWGSHVTTTWKETKGMLTSYEFGLKADNPIDIKFIGNKDGGNVGITSGGDIKLAGDIRAKDVSITSKTGSIKADSFGDSLEQKTIFSDNLKLKAGQNIEVVQQGVDKGLNLNAEAGTSKDNYIKINTLAGLKTGDVYLENVKAGGDVTLNIDGRALRGARDNYDAAISEANIVSGGNLSLSASKGIGEAGKEQLIKAADSVSFAADAGDIRVKQADNKLMKLSEIVAKDGDVYLEAEGGFIDVIKENQEDTSRQGEKLKEWKDQGILSDVPMDEQKQAKYNEQVDNLKDQAKSASLQGNALSDAERTAAADDLVAAGDKLTTDLAEDYSNYYAARKDMYEKQAALNEAISQKNNGDDSGYEDALTEYNTAFEKYAQAKKTYDESKASAIESFVTEKGYTDTDSLKQKSHISQWLASYEELTHEATDQGENRYDKYGWNSNQLLYAMQDSIINPSAGTVSDVEKANITGNNIYLKTGGDIGKVMDDQAFTITMDELSNMFTNGVEEGSDLKTRLDKLAGARADDVTWGTSKIEVKRLTPISVKLNKNANGDEGKVSIDAPNAKNIYVIAKDSKLTMDKLLSEGNVRLTGQEGVDIGTITGSNVSLEGGDGDIKHGADGSVLVGLLGDKANLNVKGKLNANAAGDILIKQLQDTKDITISEGKTWNKDMVLGSLAAKNIKVEANGNIVSGLDNVDDGNGETRGISYVNASNKLELITAGSIGKNGDGLRVKNSGGVVDINAANGAYLEAKGDGTLYLGTVKTGTEANGDSLVVNSEGSLSLGRDAVEEVKDADGEVVTAGVEGAAGSINADKIKQGNVKFTTADDILLKGKLHANELTTQSYAGHIKQTTSTTNDNIYVGKLNASAITGDILLPNEYNIIGEADISGLGRDFDLAVSSDELKMKLGSKRNALTNNYGGSFNVKNKTGNVNLEDSHMNIYGDITVSANGSILFDENTRLATNELNQAGSNNALLQKTGNITLIAGDFDGLTGSITNNSTLLANAAMVKDADGNLTKGEAKITFKAAQGSVANNGSLSTTNDVAMIAGDAVNLSETSTIAADDDMQLTAGNSISTDGTITTGGSIDATADNGSITTNGTISADNGGIKLETKNARSKANIRIKGVMRSAKGNIAARTAQGDVNFDGDVTVNEGSIASTVTGGDVTVGGTTKVGTGSIINEVTSGNVNINGTTEVGEGSIISNITEGNVTVDGATKVTTGSIIDTVGQGDVTFKGTTEIGTGDIANTVTTGDVAVGGSNNITSGNVANTVTNGDVTISGTNDIGAGNVTNSVGSGDVNTSGVLSVGSGDIFTTIASGNVDFNAETNINNGNLFTAAEDGNINMDANMIVGMGYILSKASGDITSKKTLQAINGSVSADAGNDINYAEVLASGKADLQSANGDIYLRKVNGKEVIFVAKNNITAADIEADNVTARGTNVDLTVTQDRGIIVDELLGNNIAVKKAEGSMNIEKMAVTHEANLDVNSMTTTVWGVPPEMLDKNSMNSDTSYWFNAEAWANGGDWMKLVFNSVKRHQNSNMIPLQVRDHFFVDSNPFIGVDKMNHVLDKNNVDGYDINVDPEVAYYFRYDLYELDDVEEKLDEAASGEVSVEA